MKKRNFSTRFNHSGQFIFFARSTYSRRATAHSVARYSGKWKSSISQRRNNRWSNWNRSINSSNNCFALLIRIVFWNRWKVCEPIPGIWSRRFSPIGSEMKLKNFLERKSHRFSVNKNESTMEINIDRKNLTMVMRREAPRFRLKQIEKETFEWRTREKSFISLSDFNRTKSNLFQKNFFVNFN